MSNDSQKTSKKKAQVGFIANRIKALLKNWCRVHFHLDSGNQAWEFSLCHIQLAQPPVSLYPVNNAIDQQDHADNFNTNTDS